MKRAFALALVAAVAALGAGCGLSRDNYETAEYESLQRDGRFELRRYPALVVASTPMSGDAVNDGDAFRTLFNYIAEGNADRQKIAMTTPVFMMPQASADGEASSVAGDAAGDADAENGKPQSGERMSFVLPRAVVAAGVPEPTSDAVEIERFPAGRYAVIRFNGSWDRTRFDAQQAELEAWMADRGLEAAGPAVTAAYDPPFVPPLLRRNEVLIPLKAEEANNSADTDDAASADVASNDTSKTP